MPARTTRLLNRSRLQQETIGPESPRSFDSLGNRKPSSRTSLQYGRGSANCSPDDHLFMFDKSLRNSMIQDVYYCKQQLLALHSLLQDVSNYDCKTFHILSTIPWNDSRIYFYYRRIPFTQLIRPMVTSSMHPASILTACWPMLSTKNVIIVHHLSLMIRSTM